MGVTIHYGFTRESSPETLLKKAEVLAKKMGFIIEERGWNKLIINPAEDSEWICLHFHKKKTIKKRDGWDLEKAQLERKADSSDDDWYAGGFTKTHYAGPECHVKVAEFLRFIASYCEESLVHDEADYYEEGFNENTEEKLGKHWDGYNKFISKLAGQLKDVFGDGNVICGGDL